MASMGVGSKDINEITTKDVVKRVSTSLSIYEDTKLIIRKDINLKWKEVNDAFLGSFGEDLEDLKFYVKIHNSSLYQITCRYLMFPCVDMLHWIVSYTNPETMVLRSFRETMITTFMEQYYQQM